MTPRRLPRLVVAAPATGQGKTTVSVGLMAAHSALLRGAARVFVVDKEPDRLRLAESIGAIGVDLSAGDLTPRQCRGG